MVCEPHALSWLAVWLSRPSWSAHFLLVNSLIQDTTQAAGRNSGVRKKCSRCNQQTGSQPLPNIANLSTMFLHAVIIRVLILVDSNLTEVLGNKNTFLIFWDAVILKETHQFLLFLSTFGSWHPTSVMNYTDLLPSSPCCLKVLSSVFIYINIYKEIKNCYCWVFWVQAFHKCSIISWFIF